jgi:hypothetical protein
VPASRRVCLCRGCLTPLYVFPRAKKYPEVRVDYEARAIFPPLPLFTRGCTEEEFSHFRIASILGPAVVTDRTYEIHHCSPRLRLSNFNPTQARDHRRLHPARRIPQHQGRPLFFEERRPSLVVGGHDDGISTPLSTCSVLLRNRPLCAIKSTHTCIIKNAIQRRDVTVLNLIYRRRCYEH